jgi:hypothetical protein
MPRQLPGIYRGQKWCPGNYLGYIGAKSDARASRYRGPHGAGASRCCRGITVPGHHAHVPGASWLSGASWLRGIVAPGHRGSLLGHRGSPGHHGSGASWLPGHHGARASRGRGITVPGHHAAGASRCRGVDRSHGHVSIDSTGNYSLSIDSTGMCRWIARAMCRCVDRFHGHVSTDPTGMCRWIPRAF